MVERLIRCTQCNQVTASQGGERDLGLSSLLPGVEWSSEDMDSARAFSRRHKDHATEEIFVLPESIISDKPSYEPNKVSYFEATNGRERFLIRRAKKSLAQPAVYELIPGRLKISNVSFRIQDHDLRRQLAGQNGSFALKKEMAQKFIQAFQEELESIPPEKLPEEIEITEEGETPLLLYGSLKEGYWQKVLHRCQNDLRQTNLREIEHFIHENKKPGEVLSLVIRREFSVLSSERT